VLTVSFHAHGRELLAFALSDAGAVAVLRGDASWFDFDLLLAAPEGRRVDRSEPHLWALALLRAYAGTELQVKLASPARPRAGGSPAAPGRASAAASADPSIRSGAPARRRVRRALGAAAFCLAAVLAVCLTFAAGSVAPSDARSATLARAFARRTGAHRAAAWAAASTAGATAAIPASPVADAAAQGFAELAGLSGEASAVAWDPITGLWGAHASWGGAQSPAWWQSALATWAVARYLQATGNRDPRYQQLLDQTFILGVAKPGTDMPVDFANQFMDDTAWWGLAWLAAARYELAIRHDEADAARFLTVSEWDADYIAGQQRSCGGIVWRLGTPPDTVANAEYVALTAGLSALRDAPGALRDARKAESWLADARAALAWLQHSGLVNMRAGTVRDSLDADCRPQGAPLTYTEGEVADALIQLGSATGEGPYLSQARTFLDYTISPASGMTSAAGVLQEGCESRPARCRGIGEFNTGSFKGIFMQAVADYDRASATGTYSGFLQAQASAILAHGASDGEGTRTRCDSPHDCQFGFYWSAAVDPASAPVGVSIATQTSALDALTAALGD
jgi:hypothetical protein